MPRIQSSSVMIGITARVRPGTSLCMAHLNVCCITQNVLDKVDALRWSPRCARRALMLRNRMGRHGVINRNAGWQSCSN